MSLKENNCRKKELKYVYVLLVCYDEKQYSLFNQKAYNSVKDLNEDNEIMVRKTQKFHKNAKFKVDSLLIK